MSARARAWGCALLQLSKQAEETRTGPQHYGLKSAATIPPGDGRLGWWDVSDETLGVTEQPFLLGIACVGTIPQHENHNLVIPNHFGNHVKNRANTLFCCFVGFVLTVLPGIKGNVGCVRVSVCVYVHVCVLYTTAITKLTANSTFQRNWVRKCPGPVNVRNKTNIRSKILGLQRRSLKWCSKEAGSTISPALLLSQRCWSCWRALSLAIALPTAESHTEVPARDALVAPK